MMTVDIKGLKELQNALNQLPLKIQGRPVRSAVNAAAKIVMDDARRRVPVETGQLRKAIYRGRSRSMSSKGREVYVVSVRKGKAKYANTAQNRRRNRVGKTYQTRGEAYYWRFLEFGTAKMPARPFLRPAFESQKQNAAMVMKQKLLEAIDKAAKGMPK
jgi:HK97 gp10 family phage protein